MAPEDEDEDELADEALAADTLEEDGEPPPELDVDEALDDAVLDEEALAEPPPLDELALDDAVLDVLPDAEDAALETFVLAAGAPPPLDELVLAEDAPPALDELIVDDDALEIDVLAVAAPPVPWPALVPHAVASPPSAAITRTRPRAACVARRPVGTGAPLYCDGALENGRQSLFIGRRLLPFVL